MVKEELNRKLGQLAGLGLNEDIYYTPVKPLTHSSAAGKRQLNRNRVQRVTQLQLFS